MGKLERQAQAAQDQVRAAQEQVDLMRQTARDDARAVRDQVAASIAQSEAIRDAARVFVQPIVEEHQMWPVETCAMDELRRTAGHVHGLLHP
jgi:hypothetical protein